MDLFRAIQGSVEANSNNADAELRGGVFPHSSSRYRRYQIHDQIPQAVIGDTVKQ